MSKEKALWVNSSSVIPLDVVSTVCDVIVAGEKDDIEDLLKRHNTSAIVYDCFNDRDLSDAMNIKRLMPGKAVLIYNRRTTDYSDHCFDRAKVVVVPFESDSDTWKAAFERSSRAVAFPGEV